MVVKSYSSDQIEKKILENQVLRKTSTTFELFEFQESFVMTLFLEISTFTEKLINS